MADLEVDWLVADEQGGITVEQFCRGCRPVGAVGELVCAGCGDGPLLSGELVNPVDLETATALDVWLVATGWRPAGPWCPECARWVHPRRARSTAVQNARG